MCTRYSKKGTSESHDGRRWDERTFETTESLGSRAPGSPGSSDQHDLRKDFWNSGIQRSQDRPRRSCSEQRAFGKKARGIAFKKDPKQRVVNSTGISAVGPGERWRAIRPSALLWGIDGDHCTGCTMHTAHCTGKLHRTWHLQMCVIAVIKCQRTMIY